MTLRHTPGVRAALTAAGAAAGLVLTATTPSTAADLVDWEPTGIQFVNADCARNEYVVGLDVTGTTDDVNGYDKLRVEVWDDGELKDSRVVEVQVGTTASVTAFLSFVGLYGHGAPGVGISVHDAGPDGEALYQLDGIDPFYPDDQDGPCSFGVERIGGADRVETAALLAQRFIVADTVVVASSRSFPDALSAAPLAFQEAGPLLLTRPGQLPSATEAEIARLQPDKVVVIGGDGAVSDDVLDELQAAAPTATVERVGGADRYATSALIADRIVPDSSPEVFLATGTDFPDALVLSALAARQSGPLLLTRTGELPDATRAYLEGAAYGQVWVGGGEAVVSDEVVDEVAAIGSATSTRFAGTDRYETAALVLERFPAEGRVMVATGQEFPDALTAVPVAGRTGAPIALSRPDGVPASVMDEVTRVVGVSSSPQVTLVGGEAALHGAVQDQLEAMFATTAEELSRQGASTERNLP